MTDFDSPSRRREGEENSNLASDVVHVYHVQWVPVGSRLPVRYTTPLSHVARTLHLAKIDNTVITLDRWTSESVFYHMQQIHETIYRCVCVNVLHPLRQSHGTKKGISSFKDDTRTSTYSRKNITTPLLYHPPVTLLFASLCIRDFFYYSPLSLLSIDTKRACCSWKRLIATR